MRPKAWLARLLAQGIGLGRSQVVEINGRTIDEKADVGALLPPESMEVALMLRRPATITAPPPVATPAEGDAKESPKPIPALDTPALDTPRSRSRRQKLQALLSRSVDEWRNRMPTVPTDEVRRAPKLNLALTLTLTDEVR